MKNPTLTNLVILVVLAIILFSCTSHKSIIKLKKKQVYTWENKRVSKRKYDKLLYQFTYDFIKNASVEEQEVLKELIVVYDTLPKVKKN